MEEPEPKPMTEEEKKFFENEQMKDALKMNMDKETRASIEKEAEAASIKTVMDAHEEALKIYGRICSANSNTEKINIIEGSLIDFLMEQTVKIMNSAMMVSK